MKHIVVDLDMNNVAKKSESRRICRMETIEIGADDKVKSPSGKRPPSGAGDR